MAPAARPKALACSGGGGGSGGGRMLTRTVVNAGRESGSSADVSCSAYRRLASCAEKPTSMVMLPHVRLLLGIRALPLLVHACDAHCTVQR